MCRSKAEGGHRCASHSPASRRAGRAATRIFGSNDAKSRQALELLDPKFVNGNIAERALAVRYALDPTILALAARDPKAAVRDAADKNEHDPELFAVRADNRVIAEEIKNWDHEKFADDMVAREKLRSERRDRLHAETERLEEKETKAAKRRKSRRRSKESNRRMLAALRERRRKEYGDQGPTDEYGIPLVLLKGPH